MTLKKFSLFQILMISLAIAVIFIAQSTYAGLYKWTDDEGKVHFTDDKNNIPKKYRTKSQLKKLRSIESPSSAGKSSDDSKGATKDRAKGDASVAGNNEEGVLTEEEEKTIVELIAFFESENARNKAFEGKPSTMGNYMIMREGLEKFLPKKKALMESLSKSKEPALKETYNYLKTSIAADEAQIATQFQSGLSRGYFKRIVSEITTKEDLKKKLQDALEKSKKKKEELEKAEEEKKKEEMEKEKAKKEEKPKEIKK